MEALVVVVVLQEVLKNLERFDEGLLQTLNSWIVKVQDDPDNKEMVRMQV
jgi:mRNA-degrading endonuclease RelE of RelBE toxin-antitoxin system